MVGYVFTDCDHDIHSLLLKDKDSGSIHDKYKNMVHEYEELDWDFGKLKTIADNYCQSQGIFVNTSLNLPSTVVVQNSSGLSL